MTRKILRLALPAMGENLLQMLMGVVDSYLVAQLGLIAVSGVSVANNIITLYQALFIALGAAISSLIAKSRGQRNEAQTLTYEADALSLTIIVSLLLGLISLFLGVPILEFLGADKVVSVVGGDYLAIVGGGILSLGLFTTLSAFIRALGKARLPLYISLLINICNALLSALAVFVLNWGILGVAWATIFSRTLGVFLLASQLPIKTIVSRVRLKIDKNLIELALPSAAERLMMRAGDIVVVAIIVRFGTEVVAGNAIGETLSQFNYMPGMGVATATVILVAHSLGEQNYQAIRELVKKSYLISAIFMLVISSSSYLFGPFLISLFTENAGAIQASLVVLLYSFLGSLATAGTLIYTATWQGFGNAELPFYATSFGMWFIRIAFGYLLGIVFNMGLTGVWLATLMDNIFRWTYLHYKYNKYMNRN